MKVWLREKQVTERSCFNHWHFLHALRSFRGTRDLLLRRTDFHQKMTPNAGMSMTFVHSPNAESSFSISLGMVEEKKYRWFKVAESAAELFNTGRNMVQVKAGGREVCITHFQGNLFACASKCPHAGGRMADGWVDPLGNVVCPLHRYKFKLSNGFNSSGEGYFLKTFPAKETDDGVFVGLEV